MLQSSSQSVNTYDLEFYYEIEKNGNIEEINENTIALINNLAKRVGAPN